MTELLCKTTDARPAGDAERSAKPAVKGKSHGRRDRRPLASGRSHCSRASFGDILIRPAKFLR
jgi:hypothetical protein